MTYADSVLNACDQDDRLSALDLKRLLNAHGFTLTEWTNDIKARNWNFDEVCDHAPTVLRWLGY